MSRSQDMTIIHRMKIFKWHPCTKNNGINEMDFFLLVDNICIWDKDHQMNF
jgi:hypothetical protein